MYQAQLAVRKRKTGESLREYASDIDKLTRLTYGDLAEDALNVIAVTGFTNGLTDPGMVLAVQNGPQGTLWEAVGSALKYEAVLGRFRAGPVGESTAGENEDHWELKKLKVNREKINCYRDSKEGHISRDCRAKLPSRTATPNKEQSRELNSVDARRRTLASTEERPRVFQIRQQANNLSAVGQITGVECRFTIDTGANVSVVRPDMVAQEAWEKSAHLRVETANGDTIPVRGMVCVDMVLGNGRMRQQMVVADIVDEAILGMDFMTRHGAVIDAKERILKIGNEKISLTCPEDCKYCRLFQCKPELLSVARASLVVDGWSDSAVRADQERDPDLQPILRWKSEDQRPTWEEVASMSQPVKAYWAQWNSLALENGSLKRNLENEDGTSTTVQLVLPRSRVTQVLEELHKGTSGGHLGIKKTLAKVRERFYWVNCHHDVKEWCRKCDTCAASNRPARRRNARLIKKPEDVHEVVRQNIKVASDQMKERYDVRANEGGFQEGDRVWLHNPQRRKGLCPKLQASWDGPYTIVKKINDLVYRIRKQPRGKLKVVHHNRLAPYRGSNVNEEHQVSQVRTSSRDEFEEFTRENRRVKTMSYGVVAEGHGDLFGVSPKWSLVNCVAADLRMPCGSAKEFCRRFGRMEELQKQLQLGKRALCLQADSRNVYHLVTKRRFQQRATYEDIWVSLCALRDEVRRQDCTKLAMLKIGCSYDGLDWTTIRNMLEYVFRDTGVRILVCHRSGRRSRAGPRARNPQDCYYYVNSVCRKGSACRYRHDPAARNSGEVYPRWMDGKYGSRTYGLRHINCPNHRPGQYSRSQGSQPIQYNNQTIRGRQTVSFGTNEAKVGAVLQKRHSIDSRAICPESGPGRCLRVE